MDKLTHTIRIYADGSVYVVPADNPSDYWRVTWGEIVLDGYCHIFGLDVKQEEE